MARRGPRKRSGTLSAPDVALRLAAVQSGEQLGAEVRGGAQFAASLQQIAEAPFNQRIRELSKLNLPNEEVAERLIALFQEFGVLRNDFEVEHFRNDWFRGWFPADPVAKLFLQACTFAADEAIRQGAQRIEHYWATSPDEHVQFGVATGKVQVTVVLFTPPPLYDREIRELDSFEPVSIVFAVDDIVVVDPVPRISLVEVPVYTRLFTRGLAWVARQLRRRP